jgi:hypothetical protein
MKERTQSCIRAVLCGWGRVHAFVCAFTSVSLCACRRVQPRRKPVREWAVGDVAALLTQLKLGEHTAVYTAAAVANDVDGRMLLDLLAADGLTGRATECEARPGRASRVGKLC